METNNIEMITKMVIDAINKNEDKGNGFVVPIGVSARHIHLTQEHVEALFGEGYQLTKKKDLMGGQFASNETVTIVGLKLRAIENVRILGPVRSKSQVEVSATDAIKLGMKVPVRMSGDLAGSAPIAIVGPKGAIYLKEGCIVAMRHIHMSPKDAQAAGVKDGDIVLMHDLYKATATASQTIIPELTRRGYQLVTVSELAECRGGMKQNKSYSKFPKKQK